MDQVLGTSDITILKDIALFHRYTAGQLCRLRYGKSYNRALERLRRLHEQGLLFRQSLGDVPEDYPAAKTRYVFTLTKRGARVLRDLHIPCPPTGERLPLTTFHLQHTLDVNDFFISALLLQRDYNGITLTHMEHEWQLKKYPYAGHVEGVRLTASADGFLRLHIGETVHSIILEVDRGTEDSKTWQLKICKLIAFLREGYAARYGGNETTIAVVVPLRAGAERRCDELVRWTESVLQRENLLAYKDLFQFSSVRPESMDARAYFCERHWRVPFRPELDALLTP